MPKAHIIGVGVSGAASLGPRALDVIDEADLLCGGQRLLDFFPRVRARKVVIKSNLAELASLIGEGLERERVVVLASGDPNFYGIARYLVGGLGKERVEIIPNVSSMQLAFALVKESWDDAVFTSVHGRTIEEILGTVRSSRKIGIFTDNQRTPGEIARMLLDRGLTGYQAFVCENLGGADERVTETDLDGLVVLPVSPLNVLILLKQQREEHGSTARRGEWSLGIPDHEFHQRKPLKGLITKAEVRVVSLSKLGLRQDSVVWDIGAGSGSVAIEAALIAGSGLVYAVERRSEDASLVRKNVEKFGVGNMVVVEGLAPEALGALPDPDAVFIGGAGGRMDGILDVAGMKLKAGGHVVANFATLANLDAAVRGLAARGFHTEVTMVNVARSRGVADLWRLEALDPVFIVSGVRGRSGEG